MERNRIIGSFPAILMLLVVNTLSCRTTETTNKKPDDDTWVQITPTTINYVDTEGFDRLFESSLVSQDPAIIIQTGRRKPDWETRLNAWIAAWNAGERRRARITRGQSPLGKIPLDSESIREFRLLITGLLDRVEDLAQAGRGWWIEERWRARRVMLLKPYSLRFHMDDEGLIQLILFHGSYAKSYQHFIQELMKNSEIDAEPWTRTVECSCSRRKDGKHVEAKFVGTITQESTKGGADLAAKQP